MTARLSYLSGFLSLCLALSPAAHLTAQACGLFGCDFTVSQYLKLPPDQRRIALTRAILSDVASGERFSQDANQDIEGRKLLGLYTTFLKVLYVKRDGALRAPAEHYDSLTRRLMTWPPQRGTSDISVVIREYNERVLGEIAVEGVIDSSLKGSLADSSPVAQRHWFDAALTALTMRHLRESDHAAVSNALNRRMDSLETEMIRQGPEDSLNFGHWGTVWTEGQRGVHIAVSGNDFGRTLFKYDSSSVRRHSDGTRTVRVGLLYSRPRPGLGEQPIVSTHSVAQFHLQCSRKLVGRSLAWNYRNAADPKPQDVGLRSFEWETAEPGTINAALLREVCTAPAKDPIVGER